MEQKIKKTYIARFAMMILDILCIIISGWVAIKVSSIDIINTGSYAGQSHSLMDLYKHVLPILIVCTIPILTAFRLYSRIWKFASIGEALEIIIAGAISSILFASVSIVISYYVKSLHGIKFPISAYIIYFFTVSSGFLVIRYAKRVFGSIWNNKNKFNTTPEENKEDKEINEGRRIMIVGAGKGGNLLAREIESSEFFSKSKVVCFIDDDESKIGNYIGKAKIYGGRDKIKEAAEKLKIDEIVLAMPSITVNEKRKILDICQKTGCTLKILPLISTMISSKVGLSSNLREVAIEDLLERDAIKVDMEKISEYILGKTVMVTGGGGSIGSELCRQIAHHSPKKLIILDIYENSAYDIQNELKEIYGDHLDLEVIIASVRDEKRIDNIFSSHKIDIVYHAAAHKHVPLMENSPNESIKNNVFGTRTVALAASKYKCERFVMISTDKAVNPTNIMGASKRMCEMIVQSIAKNSETIFACVRFGNVLGSNGSVVPLFKRQIKKGGPVKVTHPEITRFFMTIPEAVCLVMMAGAYANGGEIFILDMGKPVKILDLAENLIKLSGYTPYKDINIVFTGLRPGEKLYEEILMNEEQLKSTKNELIYIGRPIEFDENEFQKSLEYLKANMYDDDFDVKSEVAKIVPTYFPYRESKV